MQDFYKISCSNESLIMNLIRRSGPISRAEIAKLTGLTPPTVTSITSKLVEGGLINEYMIGESNGGRRPLLLKVNTDTARIVVINIRSEEMMGYVVDPEVSVLYEETKSIKGMKEEEVLILLLNMIDNCRRASDVPVLAIGVVVRGPVHSAGIVVFALNIGWRNLALKKVIEDRFGLPVFLENDAKTLTNGEFHYGSHKDATSMILLKVSHGIGAGIVFDGVLYRGINNSSGEVGHTTIDVAGPLCRCGNYGCLEAFASDDALVSYVIKAIKEGQTSRVSEMVTDLEQVTTDMIYRAADLGDLLAMEALKRVGRYLGIGIANMVNIFNPKLIVISGNIAKVQNHVSDTLRQTVRERTFESCCSDLEIRFSMQATENTLKGMADIIFAKIIDWR
jgi:predicted NBD/HSP70 family sugar kinase